jgi:hypothetical protein
MQHRRCRTLRFNSDLSSLRGGGGALACAPATIFLLGGMKGIQ